MKQHTRRYIEQLLSDDIIHQEAAAAEASPLISLIAYAHCTAPITTVSWTQSGDGLVSADSSGSVTMWETLSQHAGQCMAAAWSVQPGDLVDVSGRLLFSAGLGLDSPAALAGYSSKQVCCCGREGDLYACLSLAIHVLDRVSRSTRRH